MDVVLNWLMQGVVVALAAAAGLRVIPASHAQTRHGFVWAAYLLIVALPAVPAVFAVAMDPATLALGPAAAGPVVTLPALWWTSPAMAIGLWVAWSCIQTVRFVVGALAVRDARRRGDECPADVLARLPRWSQVRSTGRPTRVILSTRVRTAAVLGCGTPTIALAPNLVNLLSVDDLDRVLIHEWAHVQRRDDLAQVAQHLARIIVGWHPASWWLERHLEFEREAACDEIVVRVTGSAKGYANCLATLAALPVPAPLRSIPALSAASPTRLRARLVRILAAPGVAAARPSRVMTVCGGSGLLGCMLAVGNLSFVAFIPTSAVVSEAPHPPGAVMVVRTAPLALPSVERDGSASAPAPAGRRGSRREPRPATRTARSPQREDNTGVSEERPPASAMTLVPLQASRGPVDAPLSLPSAIASSETLASTTGDTYAMTLTTVTQPDAGEDARAVWTRAASMGIDVGRVSQKAGTATAGFFTRFGKKLADSF